MARIVALRHAGLSHRAIAAELGLSVSAVATALSRAGVVRPSAQSDAKQVVDLYQRGANISAIARQSGHTRATVRTLLRGQGIDSKRRSALARLKMLSSADAAYLAGIIDGEGCIGVSRTSYNRGLQLELAIGNTDVRLMDWLLDKVGIGWKYVYQPKMPRAKLSYRWAVSGGAAAMLLVQVLPYLVIKRDQALLAMEFQSLCPGRGRNTTIEARQRQTAIADEIRAMHGNQGRVVARRRKIASSAAASSALVQPESG